MAMPAAQKLLSSAADRVLDRHPNAGERDRRHQNFLAAMTSIATLPANCYACLTRHAGRQP